MSNKPSNPKDIMGIAKACLSAIPTIALWELGLAMLEGALKYGRHNYRGVGVRASVYYDAQNRHTDAWWEGEDIDPDSGLSHITKAIATLVVLRDAMIRGNFEDDRPPSSAPGWMSRFNDHAAMLLEKYKDRNPKHYTIADMMPEPLQPLDDVQRALDQFDPAPHYHPERPAELNVVYHTDQRPNGQSGYTIGQPHPSQSVGVDAPDAGDIGKPLGAPNDPWAL